jgi:hypothetical protein
MIENVTPFIANMSVTLLNTQNGNVMQLTPQTTDLDLIGRLCGNYSWWYVIVLGMIAVLMIAKLMFSRRIKRIKNAPEKVWMIPVFEMLGDIADMTIVLVVVVQFIIALRVLL